MIGSICVIDGDCVSMTVYYKNQEQYFYSECLQKAIDTNLERNVVIGGKGELLIAYFIDNGGEKYLSNSTRLFNAAVFSETDIVLKTKRKESLLSVMRNRFVKFIYNHIVCKRDFITRTYYLALISKYFN